MSPFRTGTVAGEPRGMVLPKEVCLPPPLLYNIYTNDQPIHPEVRQFIYADDTAVAAQGRTFEEVEDKLTTSLEQLAVYYEQNHLKPNPSKTQVCAFHLRNREAARRLRVSWRQHGLEHSDTPKYLGVKLDRALTFKQHCLDTKKKVCARNNIIRKLTSTTWGAQPHVLRTSAMALSVSAAEYAAPVWRNSVHARQVDIAVNDTGRIVSGCLKPTPTEKIYPLVGIAPPQVRREVAAAVERGKQTTDQRHPLFGHQQQPSRLRSRKSFLHTTEPLTVSPETRRLQLWQQSVSHPLVELSEEASAGCDLPYTTWKSLNRLRTGVSRCKVNLVKWGYADGDADCACGLTQSNEHLLVCPDLTTTCTPQDLKEANDNAICVAEHWSFLI